MIGPILWVLWEWVALMAERFFCAGVSGGGHVALEGDEARHLARVRRVAAGETVELFDGCGFATRAEVVAVGRDRVELSPVGPPLPDRAPLLRVSLATAVPKGERFDWLIEKATELGVERLVPIVTERSVVDPRSAKLERLRRAVIEACKQCGRNRLMTIEPPRRWADLLAVTANDLRLVADPDGLPLVAWPKPGRDRAAWLAVGPEGGFTEDEVAAARASGWVAVGLGPSLLRVETAGIVGCSRLLALGESC
jgi:16S rRNA (uracil1498-N3)-methyltransferase